MRGQCVLDAWAVMAWLGAEDPAASEMQALLERAEADEIDLFLSRINLGEVYYCIAKKRGLEMADSVRTAIEVAPVELVSVDDALVWQAAGLKARYPISYGDAFAAALALRLDAPLATGDAEFEPLKAGGGLKLRWMTRGVRTQR